MMTIEEFLVSIGYEVKESEVNAWEATLKKFDLWVAKFGVALSEFERRARALFVSATDDLDRLNFAATRTGSSVAELRALTYALQQIGISGGRAEDLVASFAERLRRFPAMASLLQGLGVQTSVNGRPRDQAAVLRDTVQSLNRIESYPLAARYAETLGIPEDAYNVLRQNGGKIDRLEEEQKAIMGRYGVDADDAGRRSALLKIGWRQALMTLDTLLAKIAMAIGPALTPMIDDLKAWIDRHQDKIVAVCLALVAAATDLGVWLKSLATALFGSGDGLLNFLEWAAGSHGLLRVGEVITGAWVASVVAGMLNPLTLVIAGILGLVAVLGGKSEAKAGPVGGSGQSGGGQGGGGQGVQRGGIFARARAALMRGRTHGASGSWGGGGGSGAWGGSRSRAAGGAGGATNREKWEGPVPAPSSENSPALAAAREKFRKELEDPEVAARFAAFVEAEVGGNGAKAQQAFIETIFNRAASRNQTLRQTLDGSYFPGPTHRKAGRYAKDPRIAEKYRRMIDAAFGGSNISGYATGNASGSVGFAGGPQTSEYGGERFGVEGPDAKWAKRQQELDRQFKDAERARRQSVPPPLPPKMDMPGFDPNQFFDAPPPGALTTSSLSADQETEIVVHGDPDPVRTSSEVGAAQSRVNGDFIDQASKVA